jgi:hypothetical protein
MIMDEFYFMIEKTVDQNKKEKKIFFLFFFFFFFFFCLYVYNKNKTLLYSKENYL